MATSRGVGSGVAATLAAVALIAGCGGDRGANDAGSAGVDLVATRAATFGAPPGAVGPDEGALSDVFSVVAAPDGSVFVSEPSLARVVAYHPDGRFSRVVSSGGDGPGEFGLAGGLGWRGDTLTVADFSRGGIHLFAPDGTFSHLVAFTLWVGPSSFGSRPMRMLDDGSVLAWAPTSNTQILDGSVTHESWLKTTRTGEILDTLLLLPVEGRLFEVRVGARSRAARHPFPSTTLVATPPNGSALLLVERPVATESGSAAFQVRRLDASGDTVAQADIVYTPRPVAAAEIDSIARAVGERLADPLDATPATVASSFRSSVPWPRFRPPVTEALAGSDGSVWMRREDEGSEASWQILDESLREVGRVRLPADLAVKAVGRNVVYGVELDAFDVPTIVRYDVGRGP